MALNRGVINFAIFLGLGPVAAATKGVTDVSSPVKNFSVEFMLADATAAK